MSETTVERALRIIAEVDKRSLAIRQGKVKPVIKRVADRGNTAYRIVVEYITPP